MLNNTNYTTMIAPLLAEKPEVDRFYIISVHSRAAIPLNDPRDKRGS